MTTWNECLAQLEQDGFCGIDVDTAAVPAADLRLVIEHKDEAAKKRLKDILSGVELYFHGFYLPNDWLVVPIRVLHELDVIESVVIKT